MQNHPKNYPPKRVRVIYPDFVVTKNGLLSYMAVCMAKNDKDTKYNTHIYRRVHFVRNGENFEIHRIEWCEGGQNNG